MIVCTKNVGWLGPILLLFYTYILLKRERAIISKLCLYVRQYQLNNQLRGMDCWHVISRYQLLHVLQKWMLWKTVSNLVLRLTYSNKNIKNRINSFPNFCNIQTMYVSKINLLSHLRIKIVDLLKALLKCFLHIRNCEIETSR